MRGWALAVLLCGALAGCRGCGDGRLGAGVASGFRVEPAALDFGRVLEGEQAQQRVTVSSRSRAPSSVTLVTQAPFQVEGEAELPGGASIEVPVTFTAGSAPVEGKLQLTVGEEALEVTLRAEGVRPSPCVPTAPCRASSFDLPSGTCVASTLPNGAACVPTNACLEEGLCLEGVCLGSPRRCDDGDACTDDGCSEATGCVHSPRVCRAPTNPCQVATCDPEQGCGEGPAPDCTANGDTVSCVTCGPVDCVSAHVCHKGLCQTVPTPEGFVCASKTPCEDAARCRQQVCTRPDAGELQRLFSAPSPRPPVAGEGPLALVGNVLYFQRQAVDGGTELASYSATGFERFSVGSLDEEPSTWIGAGGAGVLLSSATVARAVSLLTGAPVWSATPLAPLPTGASSPVAPAREASAVGEDGASWTLVSYRGDGGGVLPDTTLVRREADGGAGEVWRLPGPGAPSVLALDAEGRAVLYVPDAGSVARVASGTGEPSWIACAPGAGSVAVDGPLAWVGGRALVDLEAGVCRGVAPFPPSGLGPLPRPTLFAGGSAYAFFRSCDGGPGPCAPSAQQVDLRAYDVRRFDGGVRWEAPVVPAGRPGELLEAAVVPILEGGVVALTQREGDDGGTRAQVQLVLDGERQFACALPQGVRVHGGAFAAGALYVLVNRDGQERLEGYDLRPLPIETAGWSTPEGSSSSRRAR